MKYIRLKDDQVILITEEFKTNGIYEKIIKLFDDDIYSHGWCDISRNFIEAYGVNSLEGDTKFLTEKIYCSNGWWNMLHDDEKNKIYERNRKF